MKRFLDYVESIDWWYVAILFWFVSSLVECSFTASSERGVDVGVQTRNEQKVEQRKEPSVVDDGPKADWK